MAEYSSFSFSGVAMDTVDILKNDLELVVGFLECDFDEFQDYLENVHEIASTEAERIIANLGKACEERNGTTKSN